MFGFMKDKILCSRAFSCVDQNDAQGLLKCLDDGFDPLTPRKARLKDQITGKTYTMGFEETVASRALCDERWDVLALLIQKYGAPHISLANEIVYDPQERIKDCVLRPGDNKTLTEDIASKDFTSSPFHYCLWKMISPGTYIKPFPKTVFSNCFGGPKNEDIKNLEMFTENCKAIEEKNLLAETLHDTVDAKPPKTARRI